MFAMLLSAALRAWIYMKLNLLRKPSCEAVKRFPSLCAATIIFKICMGSEYAEMAITMERASRWGGEEEGMVEEEGEKKRKKIE